MRVKEKLEQAGYTERTERWPKKEDDGTIIRFMGKVMLGYVNEKPFLYIAENGDLEAVSYSEDIACQELRKK